MSIRIARSILGAGLATLFTAVTTTAQPGDYDRRASMVFVAAPAAAQLDAIADLRESLDGSLQQSFDPTSGVTRSLFNPVGKLTGPTGGDPLDIALGYVRDQATLLGLEASDLDEIEVCDVVRSTVSGATHVYLCQRHQGIEVLNAQLHVNVSSDGSIVSVNNGFVPALSQRPEPAHAECTAEDACLVAAKHLGANVRRVRRRDGRLRARRLSTVDLDPELVWVPMGRDVKLAWRFQVHTPDGKHVYDMTVDAEAGPDRLDESRVLTRVDHVSPGLYQVYPVPVESPSHAPIPEPEDGRSIIVAPENAIASPLGWHDDGSSSYTIMRGNNVHAYDDRNADDAPPSNEPDCGPGLECSFPLDLTQDPSTYKAAAVANLFYWSNIVHDVQYLYGFDEAAGNFQIDNFGLGGLGGDAVRAEAQDGSGIDNANFTTFPDGTAPKIQMFLWDLTFPLRDGDLDAGIVVHEYGHGISTRLVGGPSTVSCLSNPQQPGEGLSDWWTLVYTARPTDRPADPRGIGTYVLGSPPGGFGIRTQAYSTDPSVNTHTYESITGMAVPHGVGEVWGQAAWEAYWMLVNLHGFDEDLYNPLGGAGNQRMMLYVNEGLKNTACSPTFTDVRDGIIQAAIDNYDGEDVCFLWEAFAGFGLGADAVSGGPWSNFPTNGFQIPAACLAGPRIVDPPSNSQLEGGDVTFTWTPDQDLVDEWVLDIGTSRGASDVFTSDSLDGSITSVLATGLPVDGSQLFARLNYLVGGEWGFRDTLYTADLATPEIVDPAPGGTLPGSSVAFTWDTLGLPVDGWRLDVGTTPGADNLYASGDLTAATLTIVADGIPTDGRAVYARLHYLFDGDWRSVDFTYTAADIVPVLVSPSPGATLDGPDLTISWDANGGLIDDWTVYVGSNAGLSDLYNSGPLGAGADSVTVTGLPTDGRTLHLRIRYAFKAVWRSLDVTVVAADLAPVLTSPPNGSVLPGSVVPFTWTSNGSAVQSWILEVGASPGASTYFYSGTLAGDVLSATATGIPTDSRPVYVRLRYLANGAWTSLHYEYTAADLAPALVSPAPGSVLPSDNVPFVWSSNGAPVNNWTLGVGTQPGLSNLYYSGTLAGGVTSAQVTGLPLDSSTVHIRLRHLTNGVWSTLDYVVTAAAPPPTITSPLPGTELADTTQTFTWAVSGSNVTAWRFFVGSTSGGMDVFDSGPLPASARSADVSGLPTDGRPLYARIAYQIDGVTYFADFLYTAPLQEPAMASPEPGSVLSGPQTTFQWETNGAVVTNWQLQVGSSVGASDYDHSGVLPAETLSRLVTGLPTDGSDVHVRLSYVADGEPGSKDYVYTSGVGVPEIVSPTPETTLAGSDVTFSWTDNDTPVVWWLLYVGTSPGSSNLHYSGYLTPDVTSADVAGLPTDSRTIHVRLRYLANGAWQQQDYQYTAADLAPALLAPAPGSTLAGPDAEFSWTSNGAPVQTWTLYLGNTPGASNLYYSGSLQSGVTSASVAGLPTDGRTIHARLRYLANGAWTQLDYQYTAADLVPALQAPAPGSVLAGPDQTFSWTSNGAPVQQWILYLGNSPGSSNLYSSGTLASGVTSTTATALPTDARTIHARLRYLANGVWQHQDYQYTAADIAPELVGPTPGSVLPGSDVTFSWSANGTPVVRWILDVGTTPGGSNLYYSGSLTSDVASRSVSGLPTDGSTVYVRLRYLLGGAWKWTVYEYTAATAP